MRRACFVGLADQFVLARPVGQNGIVITIECNRSPFAEIKPQLFITVGEYIDRNTYQNQSHHISMRIIDPAADVEHPLAVTLIAYRRADEPSGITVFGLRLEIIPVSEIDRWWRV